MAAINEEVKFARFRSEMVEQQLRARGIMDPRVLEAMNELPRHEFVPHPIRELAYDDCALPIGYDQTISQPHMIALLLEALELRGHERVLDVGTGSGYQAALLAVLAREVISIEILPALVTLAKANLKRTRYADIQVVSGDGSLGYPPAAPYDGIVVAAGAPRIPAALVDQLAEGGRLVIPVGPYDSQQLLRVRKQGKVLKTETLVYCEFVPLVGRAGWQESELNRAEDLRD